jgi:hypothetical protein
MIDPAPASARPVPRRARAGLRQEILGRVFGIHPDFHGVAVERAPVPDAAAKAALGDIQLPGHQIKPGDQFGHRMLHLQPRVHFQKVELSARIQQELHRTGTNVISPRAQP